MNQNFIVYGDWKKREELTTLVPVKPKPEVKEEEGEKNGYEMIK